MWIEVIR